MISPTQRCSRAFSLIEVVLATAVFATSIVAVIGLMGPMTQRVDDVIDSETAAKLAESIQTELARIGFVQAVALTGGGGGLQLVANTKGDRVRLVSGSSPAADNLLNDPNFPGIANRDRYFLITLVRESAYDSGLSGALALRADVTWPFQIPVGPATGTNAAVGATADAFVSAPANSRRSLIYFFALTP